MADVVCAVEAARARHFVEFFCGTGALVSAMMAAGMRCTWLEISLGVSQDILSTVGFAEAIRAAMSIVPGGTAWFGVPCSTFVWMSRGHTKRTQADPLGDRSRADVRQANLIADRVAFILQVLAMRAVHFIVEQPSGSLLWRMPSFRRIARLRISGFMWQRRFLWLGHFGHPIAKPTELQGSFPNLAHILPTRKPAKARADAVYTVWVGRVRKIRRVRGKTGLKGTEHYPPAFCRALASILAKQLTKTGRLNKFGTGCT